MVKCSRQYLNVGKTASIGRKGLYIPKAINQCHVNTILADPRLDALLFQNVINCLIRCSL